MRLTLLFSTLALIACDGAAPPEDSGVPAMDGGADAGPRVDPLSASFVAAPTEGEGPWDLWGFMAVPIDDAHAIVVGGTSSGALGGDVFADTWRVEVTPASITAERIDATGPMPRYCACAAYDPTRDVVVVYGGRDLAVNAFAPETWELDLGTNTWTAIPGATQSVATLGCAMAHVPSSGEIYMFGGADGAGAYADTFRYAGDSWERIDSPGPVARYDAVLFPSHDGDTLLLFGGSYGAMGAAFYSDLWSFDPETETWTEILLPEVLDGRRTAWVVRDPARPGLYVGFGYDNALQPMGDFFYADLEALTWTPIEIPFEGPPPRGFSPSLPGGEGALGALFGGFGTRRPVTDSWRLVRPD